MGGNPKRAVIGFVLHFLACGAYRALPWGLNIGAAGLWSACGGQTPFGINSSVSSDVGGWFIFPPGWFLVPAPVLRCIIPQ